MSAGSLVGGIVTLFGAIGGAALIAKGINPELPIEPVQAWVFFLVCYGAGVIMLLMFARHRSTPAAMQLPGALAILLGVVAGGVALCKTLGILPPGSSGSLWAIFLIALPPGVLLLQGASALRDNPVPEPK
jgi:Flp pilus assembly protein TadB